MRCRNCGNSPPFVLLVELAVVVRGQSSLSDPDVGLSIQCPACASTDVDADPVALLTRGGGTTG